MSETMPFAITIPLPQELDAARSLCADLGLKPGHSLKQCHESLHWFSEQIRLVANPPKPDYDDLFAPRRRSKRIMRCLHCDQQFTEDKVKYRHKIGFSVGALWWCPTPGCDGAGVGHDIHPVDEGAQA